MSKLMYLVLFTIVIGITSASTPIYLAPYLQPNDEVDSNTFLNPPSGSRICARNCTPDEAPKICYYKWTLENYVTLGKACGDCPNNATHCYQKECIPADGFERGVLSVNRKIPGPSIQVCLGDRVIVDVTNKLSGRSTTIHWHGVFQQGSQYMDGVPMLTQCAILEGDTFRYDFVASNEGTHYWHSHDGMQKLDGLQGRLVVRVVHQYDENGAMYDYDLPEHVIIMQDWMDDTADNHFPGLTGVDKGQYPKAILLTGIGNTVVNNARTTTPYPRINVEYGNRYRMRIVGATCTTCPVEFAVQGHRILVIAADGNAITPIRVTSIVFYSGERYDIVLEASQQAGGPYWIHVKSLSGCAAEEIYQLGVLQYVNETGDNNAIPAEPPGYDGLQFENPRVMNPENGTGGVSVASLVNPLPVPKYIKTQKADLNILLSYGNHVFDPSTFYNFYERYYVVNGKTLMSHTVNNISFVSPPAPPLSQPADVPAELLCPFGTDGMPTCPSGGSYCECVQVIDIPLGSVVQILLDDKNPGEDISHPFHLHGYAFYVMAEGQYTNGLTVQDVYANMTSQVLMQSSAPIQKDTLAVPSNGYAIIKFRADNPGYWFYHCHFMYHIATGMGVVFKVGQAADLPPVPTGFPKCGDFTPQVYQ
ncbi:uncharacterized protein [Periplaneta americana]|uniref:uncharacterized protein n=1 Tax=Periplaneta americana TaxID=6978 RepID=UPI0037E7FF73